MHLRTHCYLYVANFTMIKKTQADSQTLSRVIINGLIERKGKDIVLLDLRHLQKAVVDYFVICTGTSDTHVNALKDAVEIQVKKELAEYARSVEGERKGEWVLIDYIDVVVHIFQEEKRQRYDIEELWGDAKRIRFSEEGKVL